MIKTIKQDILNVSHGIVCHQVNCFGAYGGLAGAIFGKYPTAKIAYKNKTTTFKPWDLLGVTQLVRVDEDLHIANMFAQYDFGNDCRKTEYGSFKYCIQDLVNSIWKMEYNNIFFPYMIGCGLGGGSWHVIEDMINTLFSNSWNIYICRID